jgi:hypothetical protein
MDESNICTSIVTAIPQGAKEQTSHMVGKLCVMWGLQYMDGKITLCEMWTSGKKGYFMTFPNVVGSSTWVDLTTTVMYYHWVRSLFEIVNGNDVLANNHLTWLAVLKCNSFREGKEYMAKYHAIIYNQCH